MDAHKPSRYGYRYRKVAQPLHNENARQEGGSAPRRTRYRIYGLHWRLQSLYRRAGCPFGDTQTGMLLWIEFGRRTRSN
ncbi:MAG: hypothetical protein ACE5G0_13840 [Rhodothermales bacterium]